MTESREIPTQYRISCHNCKYARFYGAAKLTAHVKATSHALRLMHETEIVGIDLETLTVKEREVISPEKAQLSNDPPF